MYTIDLLINDYGTYAKHQDEIDEKKSFLMLNQKKIMFQELEHRYTDSFSEFDNAVKGVIESNGLFYRGDDVFERKGVLHVFLL